MKCKSCGEEYDQELFPVCPYCLRPNKENEDVESEPLLTSETVIEVVSNEADKVIEKTECIQEVTEGEFIFFEEADNACKEANGTIFTEDVDETVPEIATAYTDIDLAEEVEVIDTNIEDIPFLGTRSKNVLRRNGIFLLSKLKDFAQYNDISRLRNVGVGTAAEIMRAVNYMPTKVALPSTVIAESFDGKHQCLLIKDEFPENKFNLFVVYCAQHGNKYVSDLYGFDFNELSSIRGMGIGKVNDIIDRLEQIKKSSVSTINILTERNKDQSDVSTLFGYINEQLRSQDISFLSGLGIRQRQIEELRNNGYCRVGDLSGITMRKISVIVGARNVDKFRAIEGKLKKSIVDIFSDILTELSSAEEFELVLLKAEGFTLNDIGQLRGVTRERVRQIIKKFYDNLNSFMLPIIGYFMEGKGYITVQEMLDIYDNDNFGKILVCWCKNSEYINYLDFADVFLPAFADITTLESELMQFTEEFIGDGKNLSEHLEELETMMQQKDLPYVDGSAYMDFLLKHGYKIYGDFVVKGRQSYGYLCARAVAKYFPRGIKLYDGSDLAQLRRYVLQEYGDIGVSDEDANSLFFLCAKLFGDIYEFRRPHIGRPGLFESISVKKVALYLMGYPDNLYYSEYQKVAKKLRWSDVTAGIVFTEIETDFIRVSADLYIEKSDFEIDDRIVLAVENILRSKMDGGFVSLINFNYYEEFPEMQYEWNVYLLRSIIDKFLPGLKVIETRAKDRRYERGIVLDAYDLISSYDGLIEFFMRSNGIYEITENNMLSFLVMHNLTYKMISKELYNSDKLGYRDGTFFLVQEG